MDPFVIVGPGLAGYTTAQEVGSRDSRRPLHLITAGRPSARLCPGWRRGDGEDGPGAEEKNPATSGRVQVARTHAGGVNPSTRIGTGSLPPAVVDRVPVLRCGPETASGNEITVSTLASAPHALSFGCRGGNGVPPPCPNHQQKPYHPGQHRTRAASGFPAASGSGRRSTGNMMYNR